MVSGWRPQKKLASEGHYLLLHGRNPEKLANVTRSLSGAAGIESYVADFSDLDDAKKLAGEVTAKHDHIDVLINNAGVCKTGSTITKDGFDVRFVVNTVAPFLLTKALMPIMGPSGRVVNLSSAAQAPVDIKALNGDTRLDDGAAYAQSKLAITMWSREMALSCEENDPLVVAVNPGSFLGSKMVTEAFGIDGADIGIGAEGRRQLHL